MIGKYLIANKKTREKFSQKNDPKIGHWNKFFPKVFKFKTS